MNRMVSTIVVAAAAAVLTLVLLNALPGTTAAREEKAKEGGKNLVHNVFFSLKDNSPEATKTFVASCKKYLTKHPGEVYFACGPLAAELKRELNDRDFDVCLTIVFKDKAAHDTYQDAKRHIEFIDENKAKWKKVRVFDSYAE